MKLCQKCDDAILNDVFGMNQQRPTDSPPLANLELDDTYIGIQQVAPAVPESQCEFWAHKALLNVEFAAHRPDGEVEHIPAWTVWKIQANESKVTLWQLPQVNARACTYTSVDYVANP